MDVTVFFFHLSIKMSKFLAIYGWENTRQVKMLDSQSFKADQFIGKVFLTFGISGISRSSDKISEDTKGLKISHYHLLFCCKHYLISC